MSEEDCDCMYKVVLVGDAGVGKTHLLSRYIKGTLPKNPQSTIGVEFATRAIMLPAGAVVKAQLWDTAGQERFRAITSAHYRRAVGGMLVYDITNEKSFVSAKRWMDDLRQHSDPAIAIILIGNKLDLVKSAPTARKVPTETAQKFAKENGLLFEEASAVTVTRVKEAFERLLQGVLLRRVRGMFLAINGHFPSHIMEKPVRKRSDDFKERMQLHVDTSFKSQCERVYVAFTPSGLQFKLDNGEEDFESAVDIDESEGEEDPQLVCTNIALKYVQSIKNKGEEQKVKLVQKIKAAGSRLRERTNNSRFVRTRDKFAFILGFLGNIYGFYLLGSSKCEFYTFYTCMLAILLVIRFFVYRFKGLHYYLLEFCYYGNLLFLLYIWVYPQSQTLYIVSFAFSMGPLAFATIVLNNSLVPHSIDKQTSTFIHVMPALTTWAIRWQPCREMLPTEPLDVSLSLYLWFCCTLYLVWAVSYYVKVFIVSSSKLQAKNYETSYILIMRRPGSVPFRLINMLGQRMGPLMYMSLHFMYFFTTTLISYICYCSYYVHTVVAVGVYVWSVYNGANYYMDYFSKHYEEGLRKLEQMKKELDKPE